MDLGENVIGRVKERLPVHGLALKDQEKKMNKLVFSVTDRVRSIEKADS